jgi:CheY-like chemotaxis protein
MALITVDLQMPVMDGWRFMDLLRCYVGISTIPVVRALTKAAAPRLAQPGPGRPPASGVLRR